MTFKKGDKVRLVRLGAGGVFHGYKVGDIFTVDQDNSPCPYVIDKDGKQTCFGAYQLELVKPSDFCLKDTISILNSVLKECRDCQFRPNYKTNNKIMSSLTKFAKKLFAPDTVKLIDAGFIDSCGNGITAAGIDAIIEILFDKPEIKEALLAKATEILEERKAEETK